MSIKIDQRIVDYNVIKPEGKSAGSANRTGLTPGSPATLDPGQDRVVQMHEKVVRPEMLVGNTCKIKTPVSEHAFYITINDILLNPGTPYEKRRPFEIFINSKNMDHYQWISGLTLIISAVFRKGGDVAFLANELRSVFDPKGGYFKRGGRYMPSLVAEIGDVIESHLKMIGMIVESGLDVHQQALVDQKRREYEQKDAHPLAAQDSEFPDGAILCIRCNTKAVVLLDGCMTCLSCGESKCG